jgi:hypothetical protein
MGSVVDMNVLGIILEGIVVGVVLLAACYGWVFIFYHNKLTSLYHSMPIYCSTSYNQHLYKIISLVYWILLHPHHSLLPSFTLMTVLRLSPTVDRISKTFILSFAYRLHLI